MTSVHLLVPLTFRAVPCCRCLYHYPHSAVGKVRQTGNHPGCTLIPLWQPWARAGSGCPLWAGHMLATSPQPHLAHCSGLLPAWSGPGGIRPSERSRWELGVKLLFFALSHLSPFYSSLPGCPQSPRAHLGQADSTPLLCTGFVSGSLVSV